MKKSILTILACTLFASLLHSRDADTVRVVFIGDVMSHGPQVIAALKPGGDRSNPDDFDYSSYFKHIRNRLDAADFAVANLEFPCGIVPYSGYPQFSAPRSLAYEAMRSGIDLFLTANNHICDKGGKGLDSTYVIYSRMGVPFTGTYRSEGEEFENNPLIINVKGIDIAFINFTYGTNGLPVPAPWKVNGLDSTHVKGVISRAKARQADIIIALPHWGEEYQLEPSLSQKQWVRMLLDNGVDAVVGSHPHVVQPAYFEAPHAVAYSLGNYISNQSDPNTRIGMLYEIVLVTERNGGARIADAFPTYLWCARKGMLERNYTVVPILEWTGKENAWLDKSDYRRMVAEWEALKKKFKL